MRKTFVLTAALAGILPATARAEPICITIDQMKKITSENGASPLFQGTADGGVGYVVYGQPETGEWIALRLTKKPDAACIMAFGEGFSSIAPTEPSK